MANPVYWSKSTNPPISDDGTIVDQRLTTISSTNTNGFTKLTPVGSNIDPTVDSIYFTIDVNGKITYTQGKNDVEEIFTKSDGTPLSTFDNLSGISKLLGKDAAPKIQKIKNQLVKSLTQRTDDIIVNKTTPVSDFASPSARQWYQSVTQQQQVSNSLTFDPENFKFNEIKFNEKTRLKYGDYYYPLALKGNGQNQSTKQDRVKFSMKPIKNVTFNPNLGEKNLTRNYGAIIGSATLPLQPAIGDSNNVDWSGSSLNAIQSYLAGSAINLSQSKDIQQLFGSTLAQLKDVATSIADKNLPYQKAIQVAIAQEAVGIQGLLSRATGSVLNPNMELLFNGPSLRTFAFSFRMSARDAKEADQIKKIIRFFKQGMSVKTANTSVFLKTPHVFDIRYITYDDNGKEIKNHPSLNRIKTCALVGCDVDYAPDGTYMTYKDPNRTMTSYVMNLRFGELEALYDEDYYNDIGDFNLQTGKEKSNYEIGY